MHGAAPRSYAMHIEQSRLLSACTCSLGSCAALHAGRSLVHEARASSELSRPLRRAAACLSILKRGPPAAQPCGSRRSVVTEFVTPSRCLDQLEATRTPKNQGGEIAMTT